MESSALVSLGFRRERTRLDLTPARIAPYCLPDADDTATAISVLGLVGEHLPLDTLYDEYETSSHFLTYHGERNASFSANCNVLLCLLRRPDVFEHTSRVVKCTQFLSRLWYEGKVKDKWVSLANACVKSHS